MESKHNLFSPSSAFIWRHCLQSKLLTYGQSQYNNEAMRRGRALHYLFSRILINGYIDTSLVNNDYSPTDQDIELVYEAYNEIKEELKGCHSSSSSYIENYFPLEFLKEQIGGTPDIVFIKNNILYVYDLKMGREKVKAYKNEQLIIYAKAVITYLENYKLYIKEIKLGILQPTIRHYDYWSFNVNHLEKEFLPIVEKIANKDYGFYTGDHCQYCPSKSKCPLLKKGLQIVSENNPNAIMNDRRKHFILSCKKGIDRLITEIENEFIDRLLAGEDIPGVDILPVKSRPVLNDDLSEELERTIGNDFNENFSVYSPQTILSYAKIRDTLTDIISEKDHLTKADAKKEAILLLSPYLKESKVNKYKIKVY